jgi:hypothetical protein
MMWIRSRKVASYKYDVHLSSRLHKEIMVCARWNADKYDERVFAGEDQAKIEPYCYVTYYNRRIILKTKHMPTRAEAKIALDGVVLK